MSPLRGTLALATILLACVACGEPGPAPAPPALGGGPARAGSRATAFEADTTPWRSEPAGEAWELASWLPAADEVRAFAVDPAELLAYGSIVHTQHMWFETVRAWHAWKQDVGLPGAALAEVLILEKPFAAFVFRPRPGEAEVLAHLKSGGAREEQREGVRLFALRDAEQPSLAWIDGRLVLAWGDGATLLRLAGVRAGREPSAQSLPGVRAVAVGAGQGSPVELSAARAGLKDGPPGMPPVQASVGRWQRAKEPTEVRTLAFADAGAAETALRRLEVLLGDLPLTPPMRPRLAQQGPTLRITSGVDLMGLSGSLRSAVENDLGALTRALERHREHRGRLPSAAEGLAALGGLNDGLSEFLDVVPLDPWGRPYAYQPEHPKRPGSFVVRSLGPDGEIDTEDDILPSE